MVKAKSAVYIVAGVVVPCIVAIGFIHSFVAARTITRDFLAHINKHIKRTELGKNRKGEYKQGKHVRAP